MSFLFFQTSDLTSSGVSAFVYYLRKQFSLCACSLLVSDVHYDAKLNPVCLVMGRLNKTRHNKTSNSGFAQNVGSSFFCMFSWSLLEHKNKIN